MQIRHPLLRSTLALLLIVLLFPACTRAAKKARYISKADDYFKAGQYDEAKIEYLNALREDLKDPIPYLKIGIIWLEQGDVLQSLQYLNKARELAPDNVEAHSKLGSAYSSLGDTNAARKEALALLKIAPDNGQALLQLTNCIRSKQDGDAAAKEIAKFPDQKSAYYQLASAGLLFRSGDRAGAGKAVRLALTLDPNSAAAHMAMADIYLLAQDRAKAEGEIQAAADLSPPRSPIRLEFADFELQSGNTAKAVTILKDIIAKTPDYMPAYLTQAQIATSARKYDEALALVGTVLTRDAYNLNAHILRAQILMAKGDPKTAMQDLQSLGAPLNNLPLVQYQLAQACLQTGNTGQAIADLKQAIASAPGYTDAILLLASTDLQTGDPHAVIAPMQAILKAAPDLDRARLLLVDAYRSLKQYDDAIALFRAQVAKHPDDSQSWFMMGMTMAESGDKPGARTAFEKAQALSPQNLLCAYQLVDLDLAAGDFASAFKRVQAQLAIQPKAAGAEYLLGKIYATQKDWPHAEEALSRALAQDPGLQLASETLTSVYIAQNKFDKAIAQLQGFLDKNPNDADNLMLLGRLYDTTKQPSRAQSAYERLLAVNPNYGPAMNNLAYIYSTQAGNLDKARDLAEKARALMPNDPGVADTLGWILYQQGDYPRSLGLLQQSAVRTPVSPEVLYHLGMADYMMDNPDDARTALRQALDSPVQFTGKSEIAPKLAILEKGGYANSSPEELEAILKKQPGDLYAQMALGDAWTRKGEWTKAAASYEQALAQNPNLLSATFNLADLYAGKLHNPDRALDLANKARALAPADPRSSAILGRIAYQKRDYLHAYNLLRDSTAPAAIHDFAWAAYSQGRIPEARAAMQRIPPSASESKDAQTFLALTGSDASETAAAASLQATPGYAPALLLRAQSRQTHGDNQGAIADYSAIFQQFPDFPPAQKNLALLLAPASPAKAYDLAVKAHNNLPDDARVSQLLAMLSYQRKDYSYAIQLLQESALRQPLDAPSLYYLGMSFWQTKANSDCRTALRKAVAQGLADPELSEANKVLAELEKR